MADVTQKYSENAPGAYFVDNTCIACDACVLAASENFKMNEDDGHAYLSKQPDSLLEEERCKEAMAGCPVEAIGDFGVL